MCDRTVRRWSGVFVMVSECCKNATCESSDSSVSSFDAEFAVSNSWYVTASRKMILLPDTSSRLATQLHSRYLSRCSNKASETVEARYKPPQDVSQFRFRNAPSG